MMRDLELWLVSCQKSAWRQALFFWQLNFFQLFLNARCGRKKRRERRLKKRRGRFPKALCYIGIQCRNSAGRKKKTPGVNTPLCYVIFVEPIRLRIVCERRHASILLVPTALASSKLKYKFCSSCTKIRDIQCPGFLFLFSGTDHENPGQSGKSGTGGNPNSHTFDAVFLELITLKLCCNRVELGQLSRSECHWLPPHSS